MKNLNRREYKKVIREFRKACPLAQVQHKWVYVQDEYHRPHLIFVYGSVIKRVPNTDMSKYHAFKFGDYLFKIVLYGSQSLSWDIWDGIKVTHCYATATVFDNRNNFKVVGGKEVEVEYDRMFESAKKYHKYNFLKNIE